MKVTLPLFLTTSFLSGFTYDEAINGDLSDAYTSPSPISIIMGSNVLSGSLAGGSNDLDLFRLDVPVGLEITEIRLLDLIGGGNASYFMLQPGSTLSSAPSNSFGDPVGFAAIGSAGVGNDLLPTITLPGITSLAPFFGAATLTAGSYAGWLNETGAASSYSLNFIASPIPEPSSVLLLGVCAISFLSKRTRRY